MKLPLLEALQVALDTRKKNGEPIFDQDNLEVSVAGTYAAVGVSICTPCDAGRYGKLEGICSVEVKKSSKNLPIMVSPWKSRPTNFTMTSIDFSAASGEVIFMAQQVSEDMSKLSATKLFSWSPKTKDFAELIDLGLSWGTLHQTTISSDGRYLSAKVQVGSREAPIDHMLLVDVVQKKVVRRVVPKDDQNIALLSMMAC